MIKGNLIKKTYSKNNNEIVLIEQRAGLTSFAENLFSCKMSLRFAKIFPALENYLQQYLSRQNKTILVIGVVHGEEPQGKFLIENYISSLRAKHSADKTIKYRFGEVNPKNRLLFIPCLNPDGLALNKRQNANGVDLNRNFPTTNWGTKVSDNPEYFGGKAPASEIETKFVIEVLEEFSLDIILTLHAPFKVINYDGPAKEIAEKISEIINYPVQGDIGYSTPGSFGTYAGVERNIPTITLELDEEIDVKELITPINKIFDYLAKY